MQISLHVDLSLFIIATIDGNISFHSLTSFDKLCYLNDEMWDAGIFYRLSKAFTFGKKL